MRDADLDRSYLDPAPLGTAALPAARQSHEEKVTPIDWRVRSHAWEAVARNLAALVEDGAAAFARIALAHGIPEDQVVREPRPPKPKRAVEYIEVPIGTPAVECRGHRFPGGTCRHYVYWIERPSKRDPKKMARIPVDCEATPECRQPTREPGRGVNHFTTCPDAGKF